MISYFTYLYARERDCVWGKCLISNCHRSANKAIDEECRDLLDTVVTYRPKEGTRRPVSFHFRECMIARTISGMINIRKSPLRDIHRGFTVYDPVFLPVKWRQKAHAECLKSPRQVQVYSNS